MLIVDVLNFKFYGFHLRDNAIDDKKNTINIDTRRNHRTITIDSLLSNTVVTKKNHK